MRYFYILILVAVLGGCVIFPGKMKDTDFVVKHVSINIPVTEAYANLRQGFRYCGPSKHGIPECVQAEKDKKALCDIYPDRPLSSKAQVMGRIQLSPANSGTIVIMQARRDLAHKEDILIAWEIFMSGRVREACP